MKALKHATKKKFHFTFEISIIDLVLNVSKNVNLDSSSLDIGYKIEWTRGSKLTGSTETQLADLKGRVRFIKSSSTFTFPASLYRDDTDFEPKLLSLTAYMVTQNKVTGAKKTYKLGKGRVNLALFERAIPVRLICKPATLDAVVNVFVSSMENKPSSSSSFQMLSSSRSDVFGSPPPTILSGISGSMSDVGRAMLGARGRSRSETGIPTTSHSELQGSVLPISLGGGGGSGSGGGGSSQYRSGSSRSVCSAGSVGSSRSSNSSDKDDDDETQEENSSCVDNILPGDSISVGGVNKDNSNADPQRLGRSATLTTLKKNVPDLQEVRLMLAKMDLIKGSLETLPVAYRVRACRSLKELAWVREKPECEITRTELGTADKKLSELCQILPSYLREAIRKKQVQFKDPMLSSNSLKEHQTIADVGGSSRVVRASVIEKSGVTQIPQWTVRENGHCSGNGDEDEEDDGNENKIDDGDDDEEDQENRPPRSRKANGKESTSSALSSRRQQQLEELRGQQRQLSARLAQLRKTMTEIDDNVEQLEELEGNPEDDLDLDLGEQGGPPPFRTRRTNKEDYNKVTSSGSGGGKGKRDRIDKPVGKDKGALTVFPVDDRRSCQSCEVM